MTQAAPTMETTTKRPTLYCAIEVSPKDWKLTFGCGDLRKRTRAIACCAYEQLVLEARKAAERFGIAGDARWLSCYEAGRDGFSIHREVITRGFDNLVIEPASLEVDRRSKQVKTDRIDGEKMLAALARHDRGEKALRVVRVPTVEQEDARRAERERSRLVKESTAHQVRVQSLLALHGIRVKTVKSALRFRLGGLFSPGGQALPLAIRSEIERELRRLKLVEAQMTRLKREREERISEENSVTAKVMQLMGLRGIGSLSASILINELFGWREFKNRRQVGSFVGLTPTPYNSGYSEREQGISKAGSRRLRTLSIQLAWGWVRYQPDSKLTRWFKDRFSNGKRVKRIGIVAVARRLLIDLWRYVDHGIIPDGAQLKTAIA